MKTLLWALTFAWSALVGIVSVSGQQQLASEPVDFNNAKIIDLVLQMKAQFELNGAKGFIVDPNNAGQTVQVMDGQSFTFFEGVLRNAITFAGLGVDGDKLLGAVPGFIQDTLNALFLNVQFSTVIPDLAAGAGIVQPGVGNVQALAENVEAVLASPEFVDPDLKIAFFAAQKQALNSFSAIVVESEDIARGPNMFCLVDKQCKGQRVDDKFGGLVLRKCNGILNGSPAEAGVAPSCDNFVAFFSLRWLLGWIILVYIIIVLWAIYMLYPRVKRLIAKRKQRAGGGREAKVEYNEQEQMVINTLAAQCASAENMLFQATDMLKQAKSMQTLLTVEARRENRLMMLTAEYFQALSAIAVTLTHQYLDHKTNTPGEKFNDDDPAVRALQLEVLNYVRDRLSLAFQADALTEKSLLRIAEAYAILKRVSDSLVLVGFSCDKEQEDGIGTLRTPIVDITENAFFLSGIFKATRSQIADNLDGTEVCVAIKNADTRNLKNVGPFPYLSDSARDGKNYDPRLQTVTNAPGKSLVYSMQNAGSQGETLQYFVRTFWGPEIAQIQQEASSWLKSDTSLESWIDRERKEREARAEPVVKRGAKKKRKKNKKNKHKHDKYQDVDETATEYTEYTEASGWSVMSNNTYVYNVESVVNQGLGIAGKPGLPFDVLGTTHKKSSKAFKFFETYFPNAAEWPKFYILIFVIIPIAIAIPMLVQIGQGAGSIDIDGNVAFKARAAGFGTSFLGVPAYYFLDGDVPNLVDLDSFVDLLSDAEDGARVARITDALGLTNGGLAQINDANGPFGQGLLFMSNDFVEGLFDQFDGASGRTPDLFTAEIQAGVLVQSNVAGLNTIRDQQRGQEVGTTLIYALMHNAGYFFGIVPLSLVRESLEILARRFPIVREIYPMSQWRDLHMNMGLAGIFYVTFGATVFLVMMLVSLGRSTPFSGLAGDPNFKNFFDLNANVLYLRQLLLPAVPLLLLMKYASRGPPVLMRKYAPTFLTKNYWETCYFLHYVVAFTAIIMLVLYRPQVFYWMGATWGFVWGGNKIVRILRTRKTTIKNTNLISYAVEDKRNNAKVRSDVLRITLNVPRSFPSSSRGQACWITVPEIDYIAHPFTLAKVPTTEDRTIMFHIGIKYLKGDDIISYARPETRSVKKEVAVPPPSNPDELPPGWKFASDPESGQVYYYNSAEGKTTWTKPRSNALDKMTEGARFLTSRFSANLLRGAGSTRFGQVKLDGAGGEGNTIREAAITNRATWTQRLAKLSQKIQSMDPDLRRNAIKDYPVYVSAPLGTSMDDCLLPSLPGSIIITTQNGLPAAESSVRWLLMQPKTHRPKFHFFVSVSREVNDALSVVETLRDAVCDSVVAGHLDIDGLNSRHAHMADWLGVYVHLTRRKPSQIEGDRDMLMKSLNPPAAPVTPQQLEVIESWVKNRVSPGRLAFDRFLQRSSQMVRKRTGLDKIAVGYCGSAKIAYAIRAAAREIPNMTFDGEYI